MIFKFGSYTHDDQELSLGVVTEAQLTAAGVVYAHTKRFDIRGLLIGDDVADITNKIRALETAYQARGVDAVLYQSDGTTETAHALKNAQTISGVRVVRPPSFPFAPACYTTWQQYTITLEADYAVNPGDPATNILQWRETVETFGGGPQYAWTQPIIGTPVRQIVRQQTTFKAMQSGSAVGYQTWPTPPAALFPGALLERPRIMRESPRRNGNGYQEYQISWNYIYESSSQLTGLPTPQIS